MDLLEFEFTVQHRPGNQNVVTDTLSRLTCATVLPSDNLSRLQRDDPECAEIRAEISRDSGSAVDFFILDDVLYRGVSPQLSVIVIPAVMRQPALELIHDGNGHMSCTRTLAKASERYWRPRMATTVSCYVQGCQACQANNRPTTWSVGKQCFMPTTDISFKIIALDHVTIPDTDTF